MAGLFLTGCAGANGCSDVVGDNRGPPFAIVGRPGVFLHRADNIHPVACTEVQGGNALGPSAHEHHIEEPNRRRPFGQIARVRDVFGVVDWDVAVFVECPLVLSDNTDDPRRPIG